MPSKQAGMKHVDLFREKISVGGLTLVGALV